MITGGDIALKGANINVSGATGGGTVKIGGDYQGSGSLPHAMTVAIDKATTIDASATERGNGGQVVVWSDQKTVFDGLITSKGGSLSGNGGDAEVSSKGQLVYNGFADLTAANGAFGTLLLDPYNVTISSAPSKTSSGFTASGDDSVINVTTLVSQLASAHVEVKTGAAGSPGTQQGNITVADAVTWSAATTLTLTAANNIAINAPITATNGGLTLNSGGIITTNASGPSTSARSISRAVRGARSARTCRRLLRTTSASREATSFVRLAAAAPPLRPTGSPMSTACRALAPTHARLELTSSPTTSTPAARRTGGTGRAGGR